MGRLLLVVVVVVTFGCKDKHQPRDDFPEGKRDKSGKLIPIPSPYQFGIDKLAAELAELDKKIAAGSGGDVTEVVKQRADVAARLEAAKARQKTCLANPLDDICK